MTQVDDPHYKKTVTLDIGGLSLRFRVSQTLFSSQGIDAGTELLLRALQRTGRQPQKVLDLGCGYGPIGVALKGLHPNAALHMVDRDALAVRYAAQNALLNGIDDALAYPSIGFDDVEDRDFDLIVANIPGKAGETVIASWLREAPLFLRAQGQVGVVVVSHLAPLVEEVLDTLPGAEVVLRRRGAGHTVVLYAVDGMRGPPLPEGSSFDRGDYDRAHATFSHGPARHGMDTVFGLPQFDSLSRRTLLLFSVLEGLDPQSRGCKLLVLNPGQGHVPVLLSKLLWPASVDMIDRDLLALRCSERNLRLNRQDGGSTRHQVDVGCADSRYDLIVAEVRDDEGPAVIASQFRRAVEHLAPGGRLVVAASSTTVTRLVRLCRAERLGMIRGRKRRRGSSVLVVAAPP